MGLIDAEEKRVARGQGFESTAAAQSFFRQSRYELLVAENIDNLAALTSSKHFQGNYVAQYTLSLKLSFNLTQQS